MKELPATSKPRLGPGEYKPDVAFERIEDLPRPKIVKQRRNHEHQACPKCGRQCYRDRVFVRHLHDVGDLVSGRPHELQITYSQHYCSTCHKYFNTDLSDLAPPYGHYTHRVMGLAVRRVVEDGLPYRSASWRLLKKSGRGRVSHESVTIQSAFARHPDHCQAEISPDLVLNGPAASERCQRDGLSPAPGQTRPLAYRSANARCA